MRIVEKVKWDVRPEDIERSKQLSDELVKLILVGLPEMKAKVNELKEKYWGLYEANRKAQILMSDDRHDQEVALRNCGYCIDQPKKEFDKKCEPVSNELRALATPVCQLIISLLKKELEGVQKLMRVREAGVERYYVGEADKRVLTHKIESNLGAISKAEDMLREGIEKFRGSKTEDIDSILKDLEKFQTKYNKLEEQFGQMKKEELTSTPYESLKEAKLL